jgi:hypothetical protein
MDKTTLTRKELYDLVWSEPTSALFKKYNIAYSGLKKICTDMNIPLPKSGHWQKIQFGKEVTIEPLPSEYSGEQEVTLFLKGEGDQPKEDKHSEEFSAPAKLSNPDAMIVAAKRSLTKKREYGLRDGLAYTDSAELNISVSPQNVARALRFMDALIKLLRQKGHELFIEGNSTCVKINGQIIHVHLREKHKRVVVPNKYGGEDTRNQPSGVLVFQHHDRSWNRTDVSEGRLQMENMVGTILAKLETKAIDMKAYQAELEKGWAEQRERRRIEQEAKEKKEKELSDFKGLLQDAERWRKLELLRNYINSVEARAVASNDTSEELKKWLTWARKKVEWYDPYIKAEDELMKYVDRDTLTFK